MITSEVIDVKGSYINMFSGKNLGLKKEKRKSAKMVAFKRPLSIDAEECDLEKFEEIHNLTQKYKNVWCTTGVHPNNVPKKLDIKKITIIV